MMLLEQHRRNALIKVQKIPAVVMKIDLAKAYDKVNWLYLKLLLVTDSMNL
jgi:hypothetical protein